MQNVLLWLVVVGGGYCSFLKENSLTSDFHKCLIIHKAWESLVLTWDVEGEEMVSGEVKFHEKNSEAYKQEMWHVREPSVFLEHSVSGRVGEERVEAKRAKSLRTLKTMSSN